ncbi:hypothetical protein EV356DRAFT_573551 [Viridothelium virens]|uniref:Uncharacterized protein n=1 Tax=Viridothelium virens TaxID=1048519 RepID=A0A6A6HJG0_VIRVR|nr:hypothetical protein EV356DRAFT_573551 [Viridothelium virens]
MQGTIQRKRLKPPCLPPRGTEGHRNIWTTVPQAMCFNCSARNVLADVAFTNGATKTAGSPETWTTITILGRGSATSAFYSYRFRDARDMLPIMRRLPSASPDVSFSCPVTPAEPHNNQAARSTCVPGDPLPECNGASITLTFPAPSSHITPKRDGSCSSTELPFNRLKISIFLAAALSKKSTSSVSGLLSLSYSILFVILVHLIASSVMYISAIISSSIALFAVVTSAAPVDEGFIDSAAAPAPPTPAGFNLTHLEAFQPSSENTSANYTVTFHIADSAAETDCSITWPATAPLDAEKYTECTNISFSASITAITNISSFSLDLDHYYAAQHSNIANGAVTPSQLFCIGTVGDSSAEALCCEPNGTTITLAGGTGVSG